MQVELERKPRVLEFVPIECDYLDGENASWAKRYLENCRTRLEAIDADSTLARYLRSELAAYEELLARHAKP